MCILGFVVRKKVKKNHRKQYLLKMVIFNIFLHFFNFIATYIVSAIWHGFYPSYYVSFVHWGFVSTLSRYFYKLSLNYPKFNYNNPIYRIIRFICPNFMMNYYGMAFYNLRFSIVMKFFKNTLWIPNIVIYVLMIFFTVTGNFFAFLIYL